MLTDKEKDILDNAEDAIKQRIEAMLNSFCPSDHKEIQAFVSTLDQIIRIRNAEMSTPCAPEIELKPGTRLASIERHG